jgi:nicotinamide riboside kinase
LGALVYTGISIYKFCSSDDVWGVAWMVVAVVWFLMSVINYVDDRLKLLEKKQERNDAMYELVQELLEANKIHREIMEKYEERLKKLED